MRSLLHLRPICLLCSLCSCQELGIQSLCPFASNSLHVLKHLLFMILQYILIITSFLKCDLVNITWTLYVWCLYDVFVMPSRSWLGPYWIYISVEMYCGLLRMCSLLRFVFFIHYAWACIWVFICIHCLQVFMWVWYRVRRGADNYLLC